MNKITVFHRNPECGFSINRVSQAYLRFIDNKEEYYVSNKDSSFISIMKNLYFVWRHRNKKGINHITGDIHYCIIALIGCKSILTIHDTVSIDYFKTSRIKRFLNLLLWYKIPLALADRVVCISEVTRNSIEKYTKRRDIRVIYNAYDSSFTYHPRHFDTERNKPVILTIGTKQNKNLIRTIEALDGISCKLRIIGRLTDDILEALNKYHIDYENRFNLTDDEIKEEYINSDIVSFISLYEGFGMPIIEAQKTGRPLICSNIPILKEIASDAALYVDPYDVESIHNGFVDLINNSNLQEELIRKGSINVQRFDINSIVSHWRELYNSI